LIEFLGFSSTDISPVNDNDFPNFINNEKYILQLRKKWVVKILKLNKIFMHKNLLLAYGLKTDRFHIRSIKFFKGVN
jgi:hypothetical protein